jgi:hypothetical protein
MSAVATKPWTLYNIEEHLLVLMDSAETVTPEQEHEFLEDLKAALSSAAEKRDHVAHYLAQLEEQQAFAAREISRLQKFKKQREATQMRLEEYVSYCIWSQGRDRAGRYRKLEGNTTLMFLRACPVSVEVTDIDNVPDEYKNVTITMPAALLNSITEGLDVALQQELSAATANVAYVPDKRTIKASIEAGFDVPGAKLIADRMALIRK